MLTATASRPEPPPGLANGESLAADYLDALDTAGRLPDCPPDPPAGTDVYLCGYPLAVPVPPGQVWWNATCRARTALAAAEARLADFLSCHEGPLSLGPWRFALDRWGGLRLLQVRGERSRPEAPKAARPRRGA